MQKIVMLVFLLGLAFSCSKYQDSVNQTVPSSVYFGMKISDLESIDRIEFKNQLNLKDTVETKLKGRVTEVCQSKGCWMKIDLGDGEIMRVTFKDYNFFVPKDLAGSSVIIEGEGFRKVTSIDQLRHFAKDAGSSDEKIHLIKEPKKELAFVATSVQVNNKKID